MHSYVLFEFYLDWWFNESQRQSMTSSSLERKKSFLTFLEHWIKQILMDINNETLLTWLIWFLLQFSFVLFFYFCCNFFSRFFWVRSSDISFTKKWTLWAVHRKIKLHICTSEITLPYHENGFSPKYCHFNILWNILLNMDFWSRHSVLC